MSRLEALRKPRLMASCLRVVALRVRLRSRIDIGLDSYVGPGCQVVCARGSRLHLRSTTLSRNVTVDASDGGTITIGSTFLRPGTIIAAKDSIVIGDGGQVADGVAVRDHNHSRFPGLPLSALQFESKPVRIGDDVWLGSKVVVLAGVEIADHAIAGAGAVVTKDVAEWVTVVGVPARPIRVQSSV